MRTRPVISSSAKLCFRINSRSALLIVKPETLIALHRKGFGFHLTWKSHQTAPGRPTVALEVRDLIRKMSLANPLCGPPRIHGDWLKLGIGLSQAKVAKYMARSLKPPSQTWHTFLSNHMKELVSTDFFVVPTVTFRVLFVFVMLAHYRRPVIHFNVTTNPRSEWTARQIAQAFPWDSAPRYLLHDRDSIYGNSFRQFVREMGTHEGPTAPRSPWRSPYVERLIGSIRPECLDHVIVFNGAGIVNTSLVDVGSKLPVLMQFVERSEKVDEVMPTLRRMAGKRLITVQEVQIVPTDTLI